VFDVGGYLGAWAEQIRRYHPHIYIFEPQPEAYKTLCAKFQNDPEITIFSYGLAEKNAKIDLYLSGIGSSTFTTEKNSKKVPIELRDITEVLSELSISEIDLIKINIEGGEYALLQRMIETDLIQKCKYIQIQFHEWIPNAHELRRKIQQGLSRSHHKSWDYPFVWESWERMDANT
jgi:FkbM family methyltransferase